MSFWFLMLLVVLCFMQMGVNFHSVVLKGEVNESEIRESIEGMVWSPIMLENATRAINQSSVGFTQEISIVQKVTVHFANFVGYTGIEVAKWAVQYGFDNPRHYLWYVYLLMFLVVVEPIIIVCAITFLLLHKLWLIILENVEQENIMISEAIEQWKRKH